MHVAYKRVLLKLSGEVFGGGEVGLDLDVINALAGEVAEVAKSGVQIAIVLGGGNFFRGAELQQRGMERARADYMGMLGIVMKCLALQDFLEKQALETKCDVVLMGKNGVDGVYSADPRNDPTATKFDELTYSEALQRGLRVAD